MEGENGGVVRSWLMRQVKNECRVKMSICCKKNVHIINYAWLDDVDFFLRGRFVILSTKNIGCKNDVHIVNILLDNIEFFSG